MQDIDEMLAEVGLVLSVEDSEQIDETDTETGANLARDRVALEDVLVTPALPLDLVGDVAEELEAGVDVSIGQIRGQVAIDDLRIKRRRHRQHDRIRRA